MALVVAVFALAHGATSRAGGEDVPVKLQAQLLAKLVRYDRHFEARAGSEVRVLIVAEPSDPRSRAFALSLQSTLAELDQVGGLRHREVVLPYRGAAALSETVRVQRAAIVYLAPGLGGEIERIGSALTNVDVLSVGAVPEYVPDGVVLGFDLVSGKPKILVNLTQARKQNVSFGADVLKLMKVYR